MVVAGKVRYEKSKSPLFRGTSAGDAPVIPKRPGQPEPGDEEPDEEEQDEAEDKKAEGGKRSG